MPVHNEQQYILHTSSSGKLSRKSTVSSKDIFVRGIINSTVAGLTNDDCGDIALNDFQSSAADDHANSSSLYQTYMQNRSLEDHALVNGGGFS